MNSWMKTTLAGAAAFLALPAVAQERDPADRADPSVIQRDLRDQQPPRSRPSEGRVRTPQTSQPSAPEMGAVTVQAIRVTGNIEIPATAFGPVVRRYVGRRLGHGDIVRLATEIADVVRGRGYGLATAWVPAQDVGDGVLVVEVEEGRIDLVRARGTGAEHAERLLAHVAGDRPVRTAQLERALLLAADMPGLWVGDARLVRDNGRNILTVDTRFDRTSATAEVDNWGTETVGPVRARVGYDVNSVAVAGDTLSLGAATTPLEPRELQVVDARYSVPVGRNGTQAGIGGYYGHTRSGAHLSTRDVEGDSSEIHVDLSHPVLRSRAASHWFGARLNLRDSELTESDQLIRDDRIVTASAWVFSNAQFAGGRFRSRVALVQGFDVLGATRRGDPAASRFNAGGVFTKLEYWADYLRAFGGGFSLELATRGQVSNRALLSSEEMGLGGQQFIRAFDYREASGDQGAAGSAELRFDLDGLPQPVQRTQLYVYIDGGRVHDLSSAREPQGLASAGFGMRLHVRGGHQAGLEVGVPLTDGAFDLDPDPRFSFSLNTRF